MENTKKITQIIFSILFSFILMTCDGQKIDYYDTHLKRIINETDIQPVKLNVYIKNKKINISSDYIIQYSDNEEKIKEKKVGLILQDSIFSLQNNSYYLVNSVLDISTYKEIEKNLLYKDKHFIYYNSSSRNSNFPYIILDLKPEKTRILEGGYILDDVNLYSYGGVIINKIDKIDVKKFRIIKLNNTLKNTPLYLGTDSKLLYKNDSKLSLEDIENLPILKSQKDTLSSLYKE